MPHRNPQKSGLSGKRVAIIGSSISRTKIAANSIFNIRALGNSWLYKPRIGRLLVHLKSRPTLQGTPLGIP